MIIDSYKGRYYNQELWQSTIAGDIGQGLNAGIITRIYGHNITRNNG